MTTTKKRPNLTITARYNPPPTSRFKVEFYFDNDFLVGAADTAIYRLVTFWGMTPEVATAVINDLWNEATSEDGNDVAEVVLSENPS
jgi:hypothetical protein